MTAISQGTSQRPLMKDLIGVNTRSTDEIKYINKFNSIREHHEWSLDTGFDEDSIANKNLLNFNPSQNGAAIVNLNNFYQQLSGRVSPAMKWLAPEMRGLTGYNQLIQEQKPICLDGFPGVGQPSPNGYSNEQAASFFKLSQITRDAGRENLNAASIYYKNYVLFNASSTYELEVKLKFTAESFAPAVKVWMDMNGNGDFGDAGEMIGIVTGLAAFPATATANFTLPSVPAPGNKVFRLRIAAISNGDAAIIQPCWGGGETFSYDIVFIAGSAANISFHNYCQPTPVGNFSKGAISEVSMKEGGQKVYGKKLRDLPSYNYFNDAEVAKMYRGVSYQVSLADPGLVVTQADFKLDNNLDGNFDAAEQVHFPTTSLISLLPTGPTGLSVMRVEHRNSASAATGIWEYPVAILDGNNPPGTSQSSLLNNGPYSAPITPNASLATHKVQLPIDQQSPTTYLDYVKWVTIMTARYGAANVCQPSASAYCDLINEIVVDGDVLGASVSGLGNLKYIEMGNEPDKWWYDSEFRNTPDAAWQMMPQQYAALLSAAYDGNGKNPAFALPGHPTFLGVKNVDSGIKVALGGISEFRGKYLKDLIQKTYDLRSANPNATKILPFDVLNIHHYAGNDPNFGATYVDNPAMWDAYDYDGLPYAGPGLCPEKCGLKKRYNRFFGKLLDEANGAVTGELTTMENWLSEFGYDSNNGSPIRAQLESGNQSYFTTQAQWLVRSYLELSAVEQQGMLIHKAMMFELKDGGSYKGTPDASNGGLFQHSGLLTYDFKPKRSWYFVQTLKNVLGNTKFTKDLNPEGVDQIQFDNGGSAPRIYYYKNGEDKILAIWSPTAGKVNDRELTLTATDISIAIDEQNLSITNYTIIQIKDPSEVGFRRGFDVTGGNLLFKASTVLISETPVFVLLNKNLNDPVVTCPLDGPPTVTAHCSSAHLNWATTGSPGGHWKVYIAERKDIDANTPYSDCSSYANLDLLGNSFVRTYTDHLSADRKSLLLDGLQPNTDYVAFLVYVDENGIAAEPSCGASCFTTTDEHSPTCALDVCLTVSSNISCAGNFPGFNDYCQLVAGAPSTPCPDNPSTTPICQNSSGLATCSDYLSAAYGAEELWTYCNKAAVTVTFDDFVLLDAIRFYYHSGLDHVEIYYSDCDCPDEKKYLTTFQPYLPGWVSITDILPAKPVKSLYFNKIFAKGRGGTPDVKIGQMHFCGQILTECNLADIADVPYITEGGFTSVWPDYVKDKEARLLWRPVPSIQQKASLGTFREYEVYIEKRISGQTTLFDPAKKRRAYHYPGLYDVSIPFTGLDTATTYDVLIRVPPKHQDCITVAPSDVLYQSHTHGLYDYPEADTLVSFTTTAGIDERSAKSGLEAGDVSLSPFEVFPNPTSGSLKAVWDEPGFQTLCIVDLNGQVVAEYALPPGSFEFECQIGERPSGAYILQLKGKGKVSKQKLVILSGR